MMLLSGCGNKVVVPKLSPEEQAEADNYLKQHGRHVIKHFLKDNLENPNKDFILKSAKYFVSQGANVNAKDKAYVEEVEQEKDNVGPDPPVFYATMMGNIELLHLFVSKGADMNVKNNEGQTLLEVAKKNNQSEIVEYLAVWNSGP